MGTTDFITDLTVVDPHDDWRELAVCAGHTQLFFARKAERPQARERRETKARRLFSVCPAQTQCRDFARENHQYGLWGGESEQERHNAGYSLTAPIGVPRGPGEPSEAAAS